MLAFNLRPHVLLPVIAVVVVVAAWTAPARADPLFGWGENALEDRFLDGDIDEDDHLAMLLADRGSLRTNHVGASDVHGESWVSLIGFTRELLSGRRDIGGFVVVGLALDRIGAGSTHRLADPPRSPLPASASASSATATPTPPSPVTPDLARACVSAALRASGLGSDDSRIDALVARARASALLPEMRTRAMRLWNDAAHTTTLASTDTANFYDAVGANLVLELRLTWRLDRVLYAGDEPTLERVRLERQDARSRLAARTLEVLFAWQRAVVAVEEAAPGSPAAAENRLRADEARATLDVLTAGWFSTRGGDDAGAQSAGTGTPP
jgi:hypothetical protein